MKIRYTPNALHCLVEIRDYIARENPQAANRVVSTIRRETEQLANTPMMGRLGRIENTRELIMTKLPYIVAYHTETDEVQILAVVHTSRRWPESV